MRIFYKVHTIFDIEGLMSSNRIISIGLVGGDGREFYGQLSNHDDSGYRESHGFLTDEQIIKVASNRKKIRVLNAHEFMINQEVNKFLKKYDRIELIGHEEPDDIIALIRSVDPPIRQKDFSIRNIHIDLYEKMLKKHGVVANSLPKDNALRYALFHRFIINSNGL